MNLKNTIALVDKSLDKYLAAQKVRNRPDPDGVRSVTLSKLGGVPRDTMSHALQVYRWYQSKHATRYVIGCRDYARAARWHILAKPGADVAAVQEARRLQALWITEDFAKRFARDLVREIEPGLKGSEIDKKIASVMPLVRDQIDALRKHVHRELAKKGGTP